MSIVTALAGLYPRKNQLLFTTTNELPIVTYANSPWIDISLPNAGSRDFLAEIKVGMVCYSFVKYTVMEIDSAGRRVRLDRNYMYIVGSASATFYTPPDFLAPSNLMFATFCGGGNGGAGGYTTTGGGGGGGGGASSYYRRLPILAVKGEQLIATVGQGILGSPVGTIPGWTVNPRTNITSGDGAGGHTNDPSGFWWIEGSKQRVPTARPMGNNLYRAQPGTLTNGGNGSNGGPMFASSGGPVGGIGGSAGVNATIGGTTLARGFLAHTGSAGGGGAGPTTSAPGAGGIDSLLTSNIYSMTGGAGGQGGSTPFGIGGYSGDTSNPSGGIGEPGMGYGSGGGGGASGFRGGDGAPGFLLLEWFD